MSRSTCKEIVISLAEVYLYRVLVAFEEGRVHRNTHKDGGQVTPPRGDEVENSMFTRGFAVKPNFVFSFKGQNQSPGQNTVFALFPIPSQNIQETLKTYWSL